MPRPTARSIRLTWGRLAVVKRAQGCLVFLLAFAALAQVPDLSYQQRGSYKEGIRTALSTFSRVDLVAARIDYAASAGTSTDKYHALFYLPESINDLHLIIREADDLRYFYWLDEPQEPAWRMQRINLFDWPTTILRYLNYREHHQLGLEDLGAVVRVGQIPQQSERVLPVALYSGQPPQLADSYSFAFRPDGPARLRFEVFPENGLVSVAPPQHFDHAVGGETQWVQWSATTWKDGWYLLKISGYALSGNGAEVRQEVHFYHSHRLVN